MPVPNAHSQVFLSSLLILYYTIVGFMSSSDQAKGQALSALFPVIVEMKVETREATFPPTTGIALRRPQDCHHPASTSKSDSRKPLPAEAALEGKLHRILRCGELCAPAKPSSE